MLDLIKQNRVFAFAIASFILIIGFGFIVPYFTRDPLDPILDRFGTRVIFRPPSPNYILGTDDWGRDVFAQLAHATRNSLEIGFVTGIMVAIIGVTIGTAAGYLGGWIDEILMFLTNVVLVFPVFPMLLVLSAHLEERSMFMVAAILAITGWPWVARALRAQVLSLKEREFVNLSRVSGMSNIRIALAEILPNMLAYIGLVIAIVTGGAIVAEAGISMLGLGPNPLVNPTLGGMLYWVIQNESIRSNYYWLYFPPGIILTYFFVDLYILHRHMDELFNPRLRRR
ncbi:MAG: ABC transporter permease [Promethearchaeota archaeon]